MTKGQKDARVWLEIAKVFDEIAAGKRRVREELGICHQLAVAFSDEGMMSEAQWDRMTDALAWHQPKKALAYYYPLTREGAKKRARLCRRLAKEALAP